MAEFQGVTSDAFDQTTHNHAEFRQLIADIRSVQAMRNAVAHGVWKEEADGKSFYLVVNRAYEPHRFTDLIKKNRDAFIQRVQSLHGAMGIEQITATLIDHLGDIMPKRTVQDVDNAIKIAERVLNIFNDWDKGKARFGS